MSHIQVAADAPLLLRLAADAGLVTHVAGASVGMAAGVISLAAKKGGPLHRRMGDIYFGAMLAMGAAAALTSPFLPDRFTTVMGLFIVYLVATAWAVVRRPAGTLSWIEPAAMALGVAASVAFIGLAILGVGFHGGVLDKEPAGVGFIIGGVGLLAVMADGRMIRSGGIAGPRRTARHLWRMTFALAIAWGSFAGQPMAQPAALRGSPWLFLPALAILVLLFYWLARTLWPRRRRAPATAVAAA